MGVAHGEAVGGGALLGKYGAYLEGIYRKYRLVGGRSGESVFDTSGQQYYKWYEENQFSHNFITACELKYCMPPVLE